MCVVYKFEYLQFQGGTRFWKNVFQDFFVSESFTFLGLYLTLNWNLWNFCYKMLKRKNREHCTFYHVRPLVNDEIDSGSGRNVELKILELRKVILNICRIYFLIIFELGNGTWSKKTKFFKLACRILLIKTDFQWKQKFYVRTSRTLLNIFLPIFNLTVSLLLQILLPTSVKHLKILKIEISCRRFVNFLLQSVL